MKVRVHFAFVLEAVPVASRNIHSRWSERDSKQVIKLSNKDFHGGKELSIPYEFKLESLFNSGSFHESVGGNRGCLDRACESYEALIQGLSYTRMKILEIVGYTYYIKRGVREMDSVITKRRNGTPLCRVPLMDIGPPTWLVIPNLCSARSSSFTTSSRNPCTPFPPRILDPVQFLSSSSSSPIFDPPEWIIIVINMPQRDKKRGWTITEGKKEKKHNNEGERRRPVRNRASAIQSIRCDPRVAVFTVRYLITVAGAISRARSTHPVHDPWPVLRYILTCPPTGTVPSPISNLDS